MPSGAKKRKAKSSTKKKMQKGEETHINGDNYSTGSHPNENDEVKSIEERESDGAEEEEKKDVVEEAEVEEAGDKEVILQEDSVVEPTLETMENEVETAVEEMKDEPAPVTEVNGDDGVTVEAVENGISDGVGVVGDVVVDVIEEKRELSELDDNVVIESSLDEEVVKPSDYLAEEAIDVPVGASIEEVLDLIEERIVGDESLKQVVASPEEVNPITEVPPIDTFEIADPVESELKENGVQAPSELSSEILPHFVADSTSFGAVQSSDITNTDVIAEFPAIDASAEVDDAKVEKIDEQSKTNLIEPVEGETIAVDPVIESGTQELSEAKVDSPVIFTVPEAETATDVTIQENSEEQTVSGTTTVTSREAGDVKSLLVPASSEGEPLTSSAPLAARSTSWMNCCGLFELFSGANR